MATRRCGCVRRVLWAVAGDLRIQPSCRFGHFPLRSHYTNSTQRAVRSTFPNVRVTWPLPVKASAWIFLPFRLPTTVPRSGRNPLANPRTPGAQRDRRWQPGDPVAIRLGRVALAGSSRTFFLPAGASMPTSASIGITGSAFCRNHRGMITTAIRSAVTCESYPVLIGRRKGELLG
jgi:hypothetical protein